MSLMMQRYTSIPQVSANKYRVLSGETLCTRTHAVDQFIALACTLPVHFRLRYLVLTALCDAAGPLRIKLWFRSEVR